MTAIDHNIPIPPRKALRPRQSKYGLEMMEVGDSITGDKSMASNAREWARRWGRKFKSRQLEDGTFRVWRTE